MQQINVVETFHYNATNQCNHYVTELFEIKIDHTALKLKSIKKKLSQSVQRFARYQHLYFGPSLGGALHLLNNVFTLQAFVEIERRLKCQFYHFWECRIQELH